MNQHRSALGSRPVAAPGFVLAATGLVRATARSVRAAAGFAVAAALVTGSMVATAALPGAAAAAEPRPAAPGQLPSMDARSQAAVIDSVTSALDSSYVFADKAARMDSLLHARLASGAYGGAGDPVDFAARLLQDVNGVYYDRHMNIRAFLPRDPSSPQESGDPMAGKENEERLRRRNFGFKTLQILPGDIGYLELTSFAPPSIAGPTAVGAMSFLANADAIIIDLRQNGGGEAGMIQLLAGYFLPEQKHLVSWYNRRERQETQSWSPSYVPGRVLADTPLFILTSSMTGSAAEEFTYDMKNLKRAVIIGERTAGAAHTVEFHVFDFASFQIGLKLPSGRAISPITHGNWEGTGVEPDVAVAADQALATAQIEAIRKLESGAADDKARAGLAWCRTGLEATLHPFAIKEGDLRQYAGTFGPRNVRLDHGVLLYTREGMPTRKLLPLGPDLFGLEGVDYARIRYTRDARGRVEGLVMTYDDGNQETSPRSGASR